MDHNPHRSPFSLVEVEPDKPLNTQLFTNNELAQHPITEEANTDPDRLFNTEGTQPNLAIQSERPEHRIIVYLKAQGLSNNDIAKRTGYSVPWVSQITRQPWFRLRLTQELRDAGVDAIQQTIKATALDSVFTLIDLRDDVAAPKAVRKAAADSLLDRYLGKPTQKVETESKSAPTSPEIQSLDREIAELEQKVKPDGHVETS